MTIVRTTAKASIRAEWLKLEELEAQIAEALRQVGKALLQQTSGQMEKQLFETKPELRRLKCRSLHLLSRFG